MRLSELLGLDVTDLDSRRVGSVADIRLVQDGPLVGPYGASLRLSGLIVVEHRHFRLLGYERDVGPWFIRWLVHRLTGRVTFVPWEAVVGLTSSTVRIHHRTQDCQQLHELPDRRQAGAV
jgi:hypothetical protein